MNHALMATARSLREIQTDNGWDPVEHNWPVLTTTQRTPLRQPPDATRLGRDMAALENADAKVAAAADRMDDAVEKIIRKPYPNLRASVDRQTRQQT